MRSRISVPGVDRRTAGRLLRATAPIDLRLDLHGMTQAQAHAALDAAVARAWHAGRRRLLVITGKGISRAMPDTPFWHEPRGVLRANVPRWLDLPPNRARVLAFAEAPSHLGGSGALVVLLRRQREGKVG